MRRALLPVLALAALYGCGPRTAAPPSGQPAVSTGGEGRPVAQVFAGTTRDGKPFELEETRGKTVMLNFFGTG